MIIVSLQVENVKRIKAVDMTPEGELIIIGGNNAQGKTSLMDAIAYAIGGKKLIPAKPIREGTKKASVKVDLGDLKIERKFWYNSKDGSLESKVIVTESEPSGRPPQEILDSLFSSLSFDPLAFSRMDKAHHLVTVKEVLGLNLDEIEEEITKVFELRKSFKQTFQSEDARLRNLEHYPDAPKEEIDVTALMAEVRKIREANEAFRSKRQDVVSYRATKQETLDAIMQAEETLGGLRKSLDGVNLSIKELDKVLANTGVVSTDEIESQIQEAGSINQHVRDNAFYTRQEGIVKEANHQLEVSEATLEEKREARISMIEAADFPIDGLSLDANSVLYNGIPFDQASSAEQLRVSVAMGFAMNPNLKVILIRDGSLLDDANLAMIREMAKEAKAQIWVERVGNDEQATVIIEDGQIKEAKG